MTNFITAAISYLGLAETSAQGELFSDERGQLVLGLRIPLDGAAMVGIVNRMQAMQQASRPKAEPDVVDIEALRGRWNAEYDVMDAGSRAAHGSRARYLRRCEDRLVAGEEPVPGAQTEGMGGRQVLHVDAPATAAPEMHEAVWVDHADVVHHQMAMASEYNEVTAQWLLQVAMLTAEQKAKYGVKP